MSAAATPAEAYLDWRRQLAIGCMFARMIAKRPEDYGQAVEVVGAVKSPSIVAASIAKRVTRMINDPGISAAALLFPKITTLEDLARSLLALEQSPGWTIAKVPHTHDEVGDIVALGLVRQIPSLDGGLVPSEALVLGPFEVFPPTRRAPVAALEIFVGETLKSDPKDGGAVKKANLAHIRTALPNRKAFENVWNKSIEGRKRSLGREDDCRAKAKVSLVVPLAMAQKLGCLP